jgi:fibronectin type 3 domain-containing protein
VPVVKPISIHSLQVHKTTGGYQLAWEKTGQENIAGYNVYRVQENEPPKLLTTLKTDQTSYFDSVNSDETVYLYTVTCVGENNVESDIVYWMGAN